MEDISKYYHRFSEREYNRRYRVVRKAMEERGLDCLVVWGDGGSYDHWEANPYYLSNVIDTDYCYVTLPLDGEPTVWVFRTGTLAEAKQATAISDVRLGPADVGTLIAEDLVKRGLGKGKIGLVDGISTMKVGMPYRQYADLKKGIPEAELVDAGIILEKVRMIKSQEEIDCVRKGAEYTDMAFQAVLDNAKPGVTHAQLQAAARIAYLSKGGQDHLRFLTIVGGSDTAEVLNWHMPYDRPLRKGDYIRQELSASYAMYSGQIARPVFVGEPPREFWELWELLLEVYKRVQRAQVPGNSEKDIWKAGEPAIERGWNFSGGPLVHGWGLSREPPTIFYGKEESIGIKPFKFEPGMTVTDEIALSNGKIAISCVTLNLIKDGPAEPLHKIPVEFFRVPA